MRALTREEQAKISGGSSQITVCGNNVTINASVYFTGPGDTSANESRVIAQMQNAWSGQFGNYNVTTQISVASTATAIPFTNTINIFNGAVPDVTRGTIQEPSQEGNNGHSFVDPNKDAMYLSMADVNQQAIGNSTELDGPNVAAHEFGHLLGQSDQTSGNSIMAPGLNNVVTATDITQILGNQSYNSVNNSCPDPAPDQNSGDGVETSSSIVWDDGTGDYTYYVDGSTDTSTNDTYDIGSWVSGLDFDGDSYSSFSGFSNVGDPGMIAAAHQVVVSYNAWHRNHPDECFADYMKF